MVTDPRRERTHAPNFLRCMPALATHSAFVLRMKRLVPLASIALHLACSGGSGSTSSDAGTSDSDGGGGGSMPGSDGGSQISDVKPLPVSTFVYLKRVREHVDHIYAYDTATGQSTLI